MNDGDASARVRARSRDTNRSWNWPKFSDPSRSPKVKGDRIVERVGWTAVDPGRESNGIWAENLGQDVENFDENFPVWSKCLLADRLLNEISRVTKRAF